MNNSKEVVKKIKSIFEKIKSSCCIDSLIRIEGEHIWLWQLCISRYSKYSKRRRYDR